MGYGRRHEEGRAASRKEVGSGSLEAESNDFLEVDRDSREEVPDSPQEEVRGAADNHFAAAPLERSSCLEGYR